MAGILADSDGIKNAPVTAAAMNRKSKLVSRGHSPIGLARIPGW